MVEGEPGANAKIEISFWRSEDCLEGAQWIAKSNCVYMKPALTRRFFACR